MTTAESRKIHNAKYRLKKAMAESREALRRAEKIVRNGYFLDRLDYGTFRSIAIHSEHVFQLHEKNNKGE